MFDLIILGGGPAGVEAAVRSAALGMRTALVSNGKPGGRATFGSLVPSKVWLSFAEKAQLLRQARRLGWHMDDPEAPLDVLNQTIREQVQASARNYADRLDRAGTTVLSGKGSILAPGRVRFIPEAAPSEPLELHARFILVASGSEPVFRPGLQPNGQRIIAPRLAGSLTALPESLLMAGGGVTGVEFAWAFASLGARVTLVQRGQQLLRGMDPELSAAIESWLQKHLDIQILKGDPVVRMEQIEEKVLTHTQSGASHRTDMAFIAAGRRADLSFYDPGQLDLALDNDALRVNEHCQTSLVGIYAAGDVAGGTMTANRAVLQARVAVDHMAGLPGRMSIQQPTIEAVYTQPACAQIGDLTPTPESRILRIPFERLLKARLTGAGDGFLIIRTDQTDRILAAGAFGPNAYDMLAPIQLGMQQGLRLSEIREVPFAHPGWSEAVDAME